MLSEQKLRKIICECIQENFLAIHRLLIEHGEIKTYDIYATKRAVIKVLGIEPKDFVILDRQGINIAQITTIKRNFHQLNQLMKRSGYFCSNPPHNDGGYDYSYKFQYEPKFEYPNLRNEINKWRYIYHVSPYYAYENIMKSGFCPACKSKTFEYPPRNYFFGGNISYGQLINWATSFAIHKLTRRRCSKNNGHGNNPFIEKNKISDSQRIYVIYAIETSLLPQNVDFYADPNLSGGYFTRENIPPQCIAGTQIIDLTYNILDKIRK